MYKTVRKGDASLQYTILPQTDQFSSPGFPQASSKSRPRIIKVTMGTLMILIILSCVATPFLMNQNDQSLFASAVFSMGRVGHNTVPRNTTRSQGDDAAVSKSKTLETMTAKSMEARRKQEPEDGTTPTPGVLKAEEQEAEDFTTTGVNLLHYRFHFRTLEFDDLLRYGSLNYSRTITIRINGET